MGILDMDRSKDMDQTSAAKTTTAKTTAAKRQSALEQASSGPEDHGALGNGVVRVIETVLDTGIDGRGPFHSAQQVADIALSNHPDSEQAIDAIVSQHLKLAAAGGFATGLGGFVTLPVALPANVIEFYLVATRMVAAVASARGYDLRQPEIRSAVLLTLVGADSDDLLKKAGVATTGRLSNLAAQRLPGPALMVVNKAVAFRLISQVGKKALVRVGRAVPLVGGAVGAGLDAFLLKRIADAARHEFPRRSRGV